MAFPGILTASPVATVTLANLEVRTGESLPPGNVESPLFFPPQ